MLLNREETEVSYSVGYFFFLLLLFLFCFVEEDKISMTGAGTPKPSEPDTPNDDTVQDSSFCKMLDATPAMDERDRFAKQELDQVTSRLIQIC